MSEGPFVDVTVPPSPPPRAEPKRTRATRSAGPRSSRPTRPPSSRAGGKPVIDLEDKINGFFQANVAAPLFGAGLTLRRRDLIADSAAVSEHAPAISRELNNLAQDNPQIAMILERIVKMGPYGALIEPVMLMLAQIVTNHRQNLLPVTGRFFRAKSLDDLVGTQDSLDEQIHMMFSAPKTSGNGQK